MKILDVLDERHIEINLKNTTKEGVIDELLMLLKEIPERERVIIRREVVEREAIKSTGIGHGIGVPHTETDSIEGIHAALGISKKGVDFLSLDGEPVYILILVVANRKLNLKYLSLLAHVARILSKEKIVERLKNANSPNEVMEILKEVD